MLHNYEQSFSDKLGLLKNIDKQDSLVHRLFYCARNLKIMEALHSVENYLTAKGFKVKCEWSESSFGESATFKIKLIEKKYDFDYPFRITRKSLISSDKFISQLLYEAQPGTGCYTRYAVSQDHHRFINEVNSDDFFSYLHQQINLINYPFDQYLKLDEKRDRSNSVCDNEVYIRELFNIAKNSSKFIVMQNIKKFLDDNGFEVSVASSGDINEWFCINLLKTKSLTYVIIKKEIVDNIPFGLVGEMFIFDALNIHPIKSKAKKVHDYFSFLNSDIFEAFVRDQINLMNYPFGYESLSSF